MQAGAALLAPLCAAMWKTRGLGPRPAGSPEASFSASLCRKTPGFGQPRPISRLGRAGRPYLPCFPHRCAALVALAAKLVLPKGWAALLWRRLRRLCLPLLLPLRLALGAGGAPSTPG
eukprot:scaffold96820_cov28-Phaeocystis_antarctica.AAC.1